MRGSLWPLRLCRVSLKCVYGPGLVPPPSSVRHFPDLTPSLPPPPPIPRVPTADFTSQGAGSTLGMAACVVPVTPAQQFLFSPGQPLALAHNTSLCVVDAGTGVYPLTLGLCSDATAVAWSHSSTTAEVVVVPSGACMDVRESDGAVGTYQVKARAAWEFEPLRACGGLCL